MCGLAGFAGITDLETRNKLVWSLGMGIDERGGHAAGFVSLGETLRCHKKLGYWLSAKNRFVAAAASGLICMLHARFATCGKKTIDEAHPFAIQRDGRTKLYGAHNGMVYNAWESAKKHGRKIQVDSQEIFECIADGNIKGLQDLDGYGVITWIDPATPNHVKMVRLSNHAEIYVAMVKEGGIVWGSTRDIVHDALKLAGLRFKNTYDLKAVGQVWHMRADGLFKSGEEGYKFDDKPVSKYTHKSWYKYLEDSADMHDSPESWDNWNDSQDWERWEKEFEEEEKQKEREKSEAQQSEAWKKVFATDEDFIPDSDAHPDEIDEVIYRETIRGM